MESLPQDIVSEIISRLDFEDFLSISRVCHAWREIFHSKQVLLDFAVAMGCSVASTDERLYILRAVLKAWKLSNRWRMLLMKGHTVNYAYRGAASEEWVFYNTGRNVVYRRCLTAKSSTFSGLTQLETGHVQRISALEALSPSVVLIHVDDQLMLWDADSPSDVVQPVRNLPLDALPESNGDGMWNHAIIAGGRVFLRAPAPYHLFMCTDPLQHDWVCATQALPSNTQLVRYLGASGTPVYRAPLAATRTRCVMLCEAEDTSVPTPWTAAATGGRYGLHASRPAAPKVTLVCVSLPSLRREWSTEMAGNELSASCPCIVEPHEVVGLLAALPHPEIRLFSLNSGAHVRTLSLLRVAPNVRGLGLGGGMWLVQAGSVVHSFDVRTGVEVWDNPLQLKEFTQYDLVIQYTTNRMLVLRHSGGIGGGMCGVDFALPPPPPELPATPVPSTPEFDY